MGGIKIKDLKFTYNNKDFIFKGLNFTLRKGKNLSIIGTSACGKTTLLKILNNELSYEGFVSVDDIEITQESFSKLTKKIAVVFRNTSFINEIVKDELRFSLENMNLSPIEINESIKELNEFFGINKILNKAIDSLSKNDKILIKILSYALIEPVYLALDDLLCELDYRTKILLINYLNYKNILLINVTTKMDDVLYTDYVLCLYDGISAIDGKTLDVLENEKLLKRLGLSLPFFVDLSIQLKLYGLINKVYLNKEAMVKNLWK